MNPCLCPSRAQLPGVNLDDIKQTFLAFPSKDRRLQDRWRLCVLHVRHIYVASESKQIFLKQFRQS